MEESLPEAAVPEEKAASEEKAEPEAKPVRDRRRFRVPTSVIVTVVVAALSVWVAPTLARQWDDRQKARELSTGIAEEVVVKSTRVIVAAEKLPRPGQPAAVSQELVDRWGEEAAVLDAKLKAYFPEEVGAEWRHLRAVIESLARAAMEMPGAQKKHARDKFLALEETLRDPLFAEDDYALMDDFSHATGMRSWHELATLVAVRRSGRRAPFERIGRRRSPCARVA